MVRLLLSRVSQSLRYTQTRVYTSAVSDLASCQRLVTKTLLARETKELGNWQQQTQIIRQLNHFKHENPIKLALVLLAGKYLAESKTQECFDILKALGFSHITHTVTLRDLVAIALKLGDPLVAANLCLNWTQPISQDIINNCLRNLFLTSSPSKIGLSVTAASELLLRSDKSIDLSPTDKARMVSKVLASTRDRAMQTLGLANRCYDLARGISGANDLPVQVCYTLIMRNLRLGNEGRALDIWNEIKFSPQRHAQIHNHDVGVLTSLLTRFSKSRSYLDAAREIANAIPVEMYNLPGLTEALFRYCERDHNDRLAQDLYRALELPVSRTVLSSLLALHLNMKDFEGASKIISEIAMRSSTAERDKLEDLAKDQAHEDVSSCKWTELRALKEHELAHLAKAIARDSLDRAMEFLDLVHVTQAAHAIVEVMDVATDKGDLSLAQKLLKLVRSRYEPTNQVYKYIPNVILKGLCTSRQVGKARALWKEWFSDPSNPVLPGPDRIHSLKLILDEQLRQNRSKHASWIFAELEVCGLSETDATQLMCKRGAFRKLSPKSRDTWLEQVKLGFSRTRT